MKENITLKFPSGEFTHTELAQANGKTNQQVWTAYQKAIKDGVIVSAGERKGSSGKPSKLWKLADGVAISLHSDTAKPTPVTITETVDPQVFGRESNFKTVATVPIELNGEKLEVEYIQPVVAMTLPTIKPAEAPFEMELGTPPAPPVMPTIVHHKTFQVVEIEDVCPFCKTKLLSIGNGDNVRVWCPINDLSVCSSSENPYGCANNVKAAVEVLHDKFFKHRK
jgi:hypothetical protein